MITAQQARESSLQDEYMLEITQKINDEILFASKNKSHAVSVSVKKEYSELILRKLDELGYLTRRNSVNLITDVIIINW